MTRRWNIDTMLRMLGLWGVVCCASVAQGQMHLRPASDYDLQGTSAYVDPQAGVVHLVEPGEVYATPPGTYVVPDGPAGYASTLAPPTPFGANPDSYESQLLPVGAIYRQYLADFKSSRMAIQPVYEKDDKKLLDGTFGGRFGLYRFGSKNPIFPEGFQVDLEGSAQFRIDPDDNFDLRSTDYRAGVPLTWGYNRWRTKLAYYHISSHAGDEFLLKNQNFRRLNYVRDEVLFGQSYFLDEAWRLYGEIGYAFNANDGAKPLEFNFGVEYSPIQPVRFGSRMLGRQYPNGVVSGPFLAAHCNLREELDFSGNVALESGWQWRNMIDGRLLRVGGPRV
jgi:hypothetical protein